MHIVNETRQWFRHRFALWLNRRVPHSRSITLDQRRIFIFPSRAGAGFALVLLVMLVAAINYQNSMAFALVFLLASVFVVAILHTFANLSGLTITAVRAVPAFVGDLIEFELLISRTGVRDYYDVVLSWGEGISDSVTLKEQSECTVKLHLPGDKRGVLTPGRLLVETFYPLGLLRAWTWVALDFDALVYPRPEVARLQHPATPDNEQGQVTPVMGSDDFYAFRAYQAGDSLKHVFWKSYAREQPLQTKQYHSYAERRLWLNWTQFSGDVEQRLSRLCYWVLLLDKNNDEYGLRLPGIEIKPASGQAHKAQVLKALALFRLDGEGGA